jgi:hypothetical protein
MTLQIVIDMNVSPDWVPFLNAHGRNVEHWSAIGDSAVYEFMTRGRACTIRLRPFCCC